MKHLRLISKLLFIFLGFACLLPRPAKAAASAVPDGRMVANFGFADGLDNSYVTALARDSRGMLWIGTESGLFRSDGYTVVPALPKSTHSEGAKPFQDLSDVNIKTVAFDKQRNGVWVGSVFSGLYFLSLAAKPEKAVTAYNFKGIDRTEVINLKVASDGTVWFSTYHDGLVRFNPETLTFRRYNPSTLPGWPSNGCWGIEEDPFGTIWVGASSGGLIQLNPSTNKVAIFRPEKLISPAGVNPFSEEQNPSFNVRSLAFDHNGDLWTSVGGRIARFNPQSRQFAFLPSNVGNLPAKEATALPHGAIDALAEDTGGYLWVATGEKGISVFPVDTALYQPEKLRFARLRKGGSPVGLSNKSVRALLVDSLGNMNIGTFGDGVDVFTRSHSLLLVVDDKSQPHPLSQREVMAVVYDPQTSELWVGTDGSGIDVFDGAGNKRNFNTANSPLTDGAILASFRDRDGALWFAAYDGSVYRKATGSYTLEPRGDRRIVDVRNFAQAPDGTIVCAASNGLMMLHPAGGTPVSFTVDNGIANNWVRAVGVDGRGRIYAGTEGHGLDIYRYDKARGTLSQLRHLDTKAGSLPSNFIYQIVANPDGTMALATGQGLTLYDFEADTLKTVEMPPSVSFALGSNTLRSLTPDRQGNLWVTSPNGIARYTPATGQWADFSYLSHGRAGDFSPRAVAEGQEGTIWFGSHFGLASFNPKEVAQVAGEKAPKVSYSSISSMGNEPADLPSGNHWAMTFDVEREVVLSHSQNSFTASYSVLDPYYAPLVEYSYRLEGLGKGDWHFNGNSTRVSFQELPSGTYTLEVRSRIAGQPWEQEGTPLEIVIRPPLWLSWPAWLFYVCAALLGAWLILRAYRRRLRDREMLMLEKELHQKDKTVNEERMRFFTNITHELRTPLSLIIGPLEDLVNDPTIGAPQRKKLSMIQKSATRLLSLINSILEFRKTETQNKQLYVRRGDLASLVREMGLRYGELNTNPQVEFDTTVEGLPAEGEQPDGEGGGEGGGQKPETPVENYTMVFDTDAVTTILDNLLSNAFKYTPSGRITLSLRHVEADGRRWAEIAVSDTGIGIHAKNLQKVFDRYFQDHTNPDITSTGIGLALVRNLAELHKGKITVESELGKGSTFRLRLDVDETYPDANHSRDVAQTQQQVYAPEMMDGKETPEARKPVVLVVEDNDDIRHYIRDTLEDSYLVHTASNGRIGLQKALQLVPDLIVTDVMMPEMDGLEMTRKLKADVSTSHIPVVILTAKASTEDRTEAYTLGAESFLAKPFTARLLRSRIANLIEQRRAFAERLKEAPTPKDKAQVLSSSLSQIDREFMEGFDRLLSDNLTNEQLDVNFLASQLGMSYSSLYRKIKALTGMAVNGYMRRFRIRRAEELLLTGRYTISEISFMVGINSPTNFRALFREEFGTTPTDYRRRIQSPE